METRKWLRIALAVVLAPLLWSCGEAREESSPWNRTLGGTSAGAPLPRTVVDAAILQDAAAYQPPRLAGQPAGGGPAAAAPSGAAEDADTQLRTLIADLVSALRDQEVELALRCFAAEHVQDFTEENWEPIYTTLGLADQIARRLAKLKLERLTGALFGQEPAPKWDLLDADHASITPNPAVILFGPAKVGQTATAIRGPQGWKLQLSAPLTADDMTAIAAFHKDVQAALERIIDWLDANPEPDEARLEAALVAAREGRMPDLEGPASGSSPDKPPTESGSPPPNESPERGGEPPEGP